MYWINNHCGKKLRLHTGDFLNVFTIHCFNLESGEI